MNNKNTSRHLLIIKMANNIIQEYAFNSITKIQKSNVGIINIKMNVSPKCWMGTFLS